MKSSIIFAALVLFGSVAVGQKVKRLRSITTLFNYLPDMYKDSFTYDAGGRLIDYISYEGKAKHELNSFTYDAKGKLAKVEGTSGTYLFFYNAKGQLNRFQKPSDKGGEDHFYTYNAKGQVTRDSAVNMLGTTVVSYTYQGNNVVMVNAVPQGFGSPRTSKFMYDNKKSPFSAFGLIGNILFKRLECLSANNRMASELKEDYRPAMITVSRQVYSPDGYPIRSELRYRGNLSVTHYRYY